MSNVIHIEKYFHYHYQCLECGSIIDRPLGENKIRFIRHCPVCMKAVRCCVHWGNPPSPVGQLRLFTCDKEIKNADQRNK